MVEDEGLRELIKRMRKEKAMEQKRILLSNREKLQAAIQEAEGRATARTITVDDIVRICKAAEAGLTKKALDGTMLYYDGGQQFPNAYKHRPESTHFTAGMVKGKWYVFCIKRDTCPDRSYNCEILYSEDAREELIRRASKRCV